MPQPFLTVFQAATVCIEYFRFMSGSEDVERKYIPEPEFVPSVTYFTHDTGCMSASVARDFHYLLLMPEPERYFTVSLAASAVVHHLFSDFLLLIGENLCQEMLAPQGILNLIQNSGKSVNQSRYNPYRILIR